MPYSGLWVFVLLELLVVVGLYALYLRRVNRRLKRRIAALNAAGEPELPLDQYIQVLQQQILDTDAKLAETAQGGGDDSRFQASLALRLSLLRAELHAAEHGGADRDRFWRSVAEQMTPLLPPAAQAPAADPPPDGETVRAEAEQLRKNFGDFKQLCEQTANLGEQLEAQVNSALPAAEQPQVGELMAALKEENARLVEKLSLVEREFDAIMLNLETAAAHKPSPAARDQGEAAEQDIAEIDDLLHARQQQIEELNRVIDELKLELADKQRLSEMTAALNEKNTDLMNAIGQLQEENNFLQEQISALLTQELEDEKKLEDSHEEMERQLHAQREAYAELEKRFAAMEAEYLAAYEENKRLKE